METSIVNKHYPRIISEERSRELCRSLGYEEIPEDLELRSREDRRKALAELTPERSEELFKKYGF